MRLGVALQEGAGIGGGDLLSAVDALPVKPGLVPVWCRWTTETPRPMPPDSDFPTESVRGLRERGIRPVVFWEPVGDHDQVLSGEWDSYLRAWALAASSEGRVIVRLAHEQNAPWMPWSVGRRDNNAASYVAMWRHVVRIVRRFAPGVRFLWCPDVSNVRLIVPTFPGDRWVDLVGVDGYRWPGKPLTPSAIYGRAITAVRALSARPLVIAEFGVAGDYPEAERRRWLLNATRYFLEQDVHSAIYFDIDMRQASNGKHPDWRLGPLAQRWGALMGSAA